MVRFLYYLGTFQVQKSYKCEIVIEEDAENFYFSMNNMKILPIEIIRNAIAKSYDFIEYEIKEDYLSFKLPRAEKEEATVKVKQENKAVEPPKVEEAPPEVSYEKSKEKVLQTYADILDPASLGEFEHLMSKLQTEISMMGSSSLELDDIDTMNEYIKQISTILAISQDAFSISESLKSFSLLLDDYTEDFFQESRCFTYGEGIFK